MTDTYSPLPRTGLKFLDLTDEEEREQFEQVKNSLLRFVQGYQWGLWARNFILQRKNLHDTVCILADYLNLSPDEKYAILAADSRRERSALISKAINEFIEMTKVSEEAGRGSEGQS